ncbi:unnamed protein product [Angiostrongylus costaricensis]|uniref:RUN domain-containing protein n=1 Tax=Angiostrongylus costaricensis TaxID=334426 RepID=A0A0R3PG34_ANGCS|nr:unnamed protein product [Angiostrongylus costaricensis]
MSSRSEEFLIKIKFLSKTSAWAINRDSFSISLLGEQLYNLLLRCAYENPYLFCFVVRPHHIYDAVHLLQYVLDQQSNNESVSFKRINPSSSPMLQGMKTPLVKTKVSLNTAVDCVHNRFVLFSQDLLSIEVRRKAEAGLSHASSMQSIRGSVGNLSPFSQYLVSVLKNCLFQDPKFRSFSAKTTEKQKEVIDRLSRLRESLRSKGSFTERDPHSKNRSDVDDINSRIQSTTGISC